MALWRAKTDYVRRLPHLLAGLAVADEESVRHVAVRCRDQWMFYPRQECHHKRTWELMGPGASFGEQLQLFIAGEHRRNLSWRFRFELAKYRIGSPVETFIECPYSLVRAEGGNIGSTRVSLSNRLPMMGRWLLKDQVQIENVV